MEKDILKSLSAALCIGYEDTGRSKLISWLAGSPAIHTTISMMQNFRAENLCF